MINLTEFVEIAGYPDYLVNPSGDLYSLKQNKILKYYRYRGYCKYTLRFNVGTVAVRRRISRHRLMGLLFLKKPDDFDPNYHQVNHINGIPGDDRLDNLEWVTPSENTRHAIEHGLQTSEPKAFEVRNIVTGGILKFKSIKEGIRYFDVSAVTIKYYVSNSDGCKAFYVDGDYYQFKLSTSEKPWVLTDIPKGLLNRPNIYYIRWSNSTKIIKVIGFKELSNLINTPKEILHRQLSKNKVAVVKLDNTATLHVSRTLPNIKNMA